MAGWREELRGLAESLGSRIKRGADALERLMDHDPYHIVGYRGYGRPGRVLVLGRVLQQEGLPLPDPAHSSRRNLVAMLKRLESDPLARARVRLRLPDGDRELIADDEGFIREWVEIHRVDEGWGAIQLELADESGGMARTTEAPFLVPPATARYGVISDMDDTVIQSHVTSFLRAARVVLLENARTRLPFPGVAGFYRALQAGADGRSRNPIFYVSGSPWNLYDLISDFLDAQGIPAGPLLLRDWDLGPSLLRNAPHKRKVIHEVLGTYPSLQFMLIGDSTQEDPEIYAEIVGENPGRILAVYIRNVLAHPERSSQIQRLAEQVTAVGSTLVLADDTLAAARHAAARGWIMPEALTEVGAEKRADEAGPEKTDAPGVDKKPAPTVVIDPDVGPSQLS